LTVGTFASDYKFFHKDFLQEIRPSETTMMASFVAAIDIGGKVAACFASNSRLF
jgi:hypothetical protein